MDMDTTRPKSIRYLAYAAAVLTMAWLVHLLAPILAPFVAAAILAYICTPMVDYLQRRKLPRSLAVVVVMTCVVLAIVILVPLVIDQTAILSAKVPALLDWLRHTALPWITERTGLEPGEGWMKLKEALAKNFQSAAHLLATLLPTLGASGLALLSFTGMLVLLPIALFFFLRDWHRFTGHLAGLIPRRLLPDISSIVREIDSVLGEFLRGQLSVMVALSVIYGLGLWIVGVDGALSIGVLAGTLSFVPYLGFATGALLGTFAAITQFQTLGGVAGVWAVFVAGQLLESYVLTPKLVGDRIGLHPLGVVFAIMAFGHLLGFVGVLLAIPFAASFLVLMRFFLRRYKAGSLYQD
ncbi:MAG: AI-2E family transporter [Betaproteobacteria bacterium]|nr:AI-2E family transporter [Betaproteobacteria bacterium]